MVKNFTNTRSHPSHSPHIIFAAILVIVGIAALKGRGQSPAGESAPTYIGSQACLLCHRDTAAAWPETAHGKALADASLPSELQDCESCHGPGSAHAGSTGKQKITNLAELTRAQIETICAKCHLGERAASIPSAWPALETKYWQTGSHSSQTKSCLSCHKIHTSETRSLTSPSEQLCVSCHKDLVNPKAGGFTHQPVAKGQCALCHDPHGTAAPHDIKPTAMQECLKCHDATKAQFAAAHKGYQVAESNCARCHDPHSFDKGRALLRKVSHPPFAKGNCAQCHTKAPTADLVKPVKDLCFGCHSKERIVPQQDSTGKALHVHAPALAGLCTRCHDPHVSDTPAGLVDKVSAICFTCHKDINKAAKASHPHKPAAEGNCLACHKPHVAAEKGLLPDKQESLCARCHKEQAMHAHPVGEKTKDPHTGEPLTCTSCHAVHGSEFNGILPQEQTAMCLGCHRLEEEESAPKQPAAPQN